MAATRADVKRNLRAQLRRQREERYVEHNLLHLLELPEFSSASVIASYYSYGTEPDTHALNEAIIASGKTLLLPRIKEDTLEWVQWDGSAATLSTQGNFQEPTGPNFLELEKIDLVLVPALAIDPDGYRLGQGGGYYDRALPLLRAWKHGVVYSYERMEHDLPREALDVAVDSW
jgi:5-formyltetrahydrofolate cyclo-ligase